MAPRFSKAELAAAKKKIDARRASEAETKQTQESLNAFPASATPAAQLQKQLRNAPSPVSENVNHAGAMSALATDMSARIHHAASDDPIQAEMLTVANSHVNDALKHIKSHEAAHAAGNTKGAMGYLAAAGAHLSSAANSLPSNWSNRLLKDNLSFNRTPWRVPAQESPKEHKDFVSLENVHKKINDITDAYKAHLEVSGASIPKEVANIPHVNEDTFMPLPRKRTEPMFTQSSTLDAEARRMQRHAAEPQAEPSNLADHFSAGSDHGRH